MPSTPAFYPPPDEVVAASRSPWQWYNVWSQAGLCRIIETEWFPESAEDQKVLAKKCLGCPVRRQCLQYALETGEHSGVWGGLTERELRKTAGLTPQGTKRCTPAANVCCPWCRSRTLEAVGEDRVKCCSCGFDWPGMIPEPKEQEASA